MPSIDRITQIPTLRCLRSSLRIRRNHILPSNIEALPSAKHQRLPELAARAKAEKRSACLSQGEPSFELGRRPEELPGPSPLERWDGNAFGAPAAFSLRSGRPVKGSLRPALRRGP